MKEGTVYMLKLPEDMASIVNQLADKESNPRATVLRRLLSKAIEVEGLYEQFGETGQRI